MATSSSSHSKEMMYSEDSYGMQIASNSHIAPKNTPRFFLGFRFFRSLLTGVAGGSTAELT